MTGRKDARSHDANCVAPTARKGRRTCLSDFPASRTSTNLTRIPDDWRKHLPDPGSYYGQHVDKLGKPNGAGWAQAVCPFHDDHNKSLSVCTEDGRGGWRCFAGCGAGDLIGFHSRLRGLSFRAAVRELLDLRA